MRIIETVGLGVNANLLLKWREVREEVRDSVGSGCSDAEK
jgi:hypothetical protein